MKKHFLAMIIVLNMILILTSCGQSNNQSNTISSPASNEQTVSGDTSDAEPSQVDEAQEPDIERSYFTVDFYGDDAGNPKTVSLILPTDWTSDPSGIFDDQGNWIASVELRKKEADSPFADTDERYKDAVSTREMTVSGYTAKLYVLGFEERGNGEMAAGTQYLYYIMADDAYVLVFFAPKETTEIDTDTFDNIVSSLELVD